MDVRSRTCLDMKSATPRSDVAATVFAKSEKAARSLARDWFNESTVSSQPRREATTAATACSAVASAPVRSSFAASINMSACFNMLVRAYSLALRADCSTERCMFATDCFSAFTSFSLRTIKSSKTVFMCDRDSRSTS